jgi:putative oxidoreductase
MSLSCAVSRSDVRATPTRKWVGFWGVKGIVAAVFLAAGGAKLIGRPMLVDGVHRNWSMGQWTGCGRLAGNGG